MRTTRLLLLAGTVLPGLLTGQTASALTSGPQGVIVTAQGGPGMEREPRGGGEGPRGGPPGGARPDRGAPERPPAERAAPPAARERPEPRPAPAQARPAPERPAREPAERASPPPPRERPAERPAPAPRQEAPRPPAPERSAPPAARERAPEPAEQPARRQPPAPPVTPRTAPEPARPAPEQQRPAAPPAGEKASPNAGPGKPVQRPDAAPPARLGPPPGKTAPAPGAEQPGPGERGTGQRGGGPSGTNRPGTGKADTPAPNAAPDVPGRPVQGPANPPSGTGRPGMGKPNAPAPNAAPGVPGRPVQGPANPPPGTPPNAGVKQAPDAGAPQPGGPPPNAPPPNMRPGVPGRPVGQPPPAPDGQGGGAYPPPVGPGDPGRPGVPGAGVQPGYGPGQPGGVPTGRADDRGTGFNRPGRPGYVPGGFRDDEDVRDYSRIQRDRRAYNEDGRTYIREPGRIIVQDRGGYFIRHDENERFRDLDRRAFRSERRGADTYTYLDRPGGEQIVTVVDDDGRMLRRYRRLRDGREVTIIDNGYGGGPRRAIYEDVVDLPPPDIRIPRERYVVTYEGADERSVYEALAAPPVVALDRRYSLDQVRNSPQLRARMRSVDIDTITFESGSFTVTNDQAQRLSTIAAAINQAVRANPQEVFLIEGYTDAVGADVDNLSLSDRRAQSVATVLTQQFQVPPENLTTQGYGEQYLKVNTQSASRENRRVTVRRITPLIQQGQAGAPPQ